MRPNKLLIAVILIIGVVVLYPNILDLGFIGNTGLSQVDYPVIYYSAGDVGRYACQNDALYAPEWRGYDQEVRYAIAYNPTQLETAINSNMDSWRSSKNRQVEGFEKIVQLDEGIPPRITCDGVKSCDYTSGGATFELDTDGLCYFAQKIEYFRFENNKCNNILLNPREILSTDYDSLEECQVNIKETSSSPSTPAVDTIFKEVYIECTANIQCVDVCGDKVPTCMNNLCECSGQKVKVVEEIPISEAGLFDKINYWIDNLINSIVGIFK